MFAINLLNSAEGKLMYFRVEIFDAPLRMSGAERV
jgi:hypothetical protein